MTPNPFSQNNQLFNSYNDLYLSIQRSSELYVDDTISKSQQQDTNLVLILVFSVIILFISILILFPVITKVNSSMEDVLCLFLDIPKYTVKSLSNKCEKFLTQLSEEGENASIDSDLNSVADEKQQSDLPVQDDSSSRRRRTTKQFKSSRIVHRKFYFRCIFGILCIQSYFIANYVKSSKVFNNFEDQAIEIQYLAKVEPFLAFTLNSLRECIATDNDIKIFHQEALQISKTQIEEIYSLYSKLFEKHLQNQGIHTGKYMDSFQDIVRKDACQVLDLNSFQISLQECQLFAKGIVSQGMQPALI